MANGQIDFYDIGSNIDLYARAKSIQGVQVRQAPTPDYMHLTFNCAQGSILSDARLRLALMRGLDAKTITKALIGAMVKSDVQVTGNHFFLLGTKQYRDNSGAASYDRNAAARQLDELGWTRNGDYREKDGKELSVRYVVPTPSVIADNLAKLVQSQLKEIGVKVEIRAVPSGDFFKEYVNVGNFDLTGFRWLSTATPISTSRAIYYLDPGHVALNYGRIGSDEINKLFDAANAELDDAKRAELADRIDQKIWEIAHQLPLFQLAGAVAVRANVANFGAVGYANAPFDFVHIGFTG
jgi:peptide/nickel transport system substrate-binding protein